MSTVYDNNNSLLALWNRFNLLVPLYPIVIAIICLSQIIKIDEEALIAFCFFTLLFIIVFFFCNVFFTWSNTFTYNLINSLRILDYLHYYIFQNYLLFLNTVIGPEQLTVHLSLFENRLKNISRYKKNLKEVLFFNIKNFIMTFYLVFTYSLWFILYRTYFFNYQIGMQISKDQFSISNYSLDVLTNCLYLTINKKGLYYIQKNYNFNSQTDFNFFLIFLLLRRFKNLSNLKISNNVTISPTISKAFLNFFFNNNNKLNLNTNNVLYFFKDCFLFFQFFSIGTNINYIEDENCESYKNNSRLIRLSDVKENLENNPINNFKIVKNSSISSESTICEIELLNNFETSADDSYEYIINDDSNINFNIGEDDFFYLLLLKLHI